MKKVMMLFVVLAGVMPCVSSMDDNAYLSDSDDNLDEGSFAHEGGQRSKGFGSLVPLAAVSGASLVAASISTGVVGEKTRQAYKQLNEAKKALAAAPNDVDAKKAYREVLTRAIGLTLATIVLASFAGAGAYGVGRSVADFRLLRKMQTRDSSANVEIDYDASIDFLSSNYNHSNTVRGQYLNERQRAFEVVAGGRGRGFKNKAKGLWDAVRIHSLFHTQKKYDRRQQDEAERMVEEEVGDVYANFHADIIAANNQWRRFSPGLQHKFLNFVREGVVKIDDGQSVRNASSELTSALKEGDSILFGQFKYVYDSQGSTLGNYVFVLESNSERKLTLTNDEVRELGFSIPR